MKRKIILASKSKPRKTILTATGLKFEVQKSSYKEDMNEKIPAYKLVQKLALGKAQNIAKKHENAIIIGADSFVVLDKEFLGKPHTAKRAKEMLKKAGGYAVQGAGSVLIEKINGNHTNVIGLPTNKIYKYLLELGVDILE